LELAAARAFDAVASVELVQEFAFHRLRRHGDPSGAAGEASELSKLLRLEPFDRAVLAESLRLAGIGAARGRDAVHAATALLHGLDAVITPDGDFDGIPGLVRISPADLPAWIDAGGGTGLGGVRRGD
jgi:predicted nucleic acid-binding protein